MPLQNRVDPWGRLWAISARGNLMGNRGILHDDSKRIIRRWQAKRWICCVLEFRGRSRDVFEPHRYSQLFFLDEATAFAAGHRPCAECRRARFNEFKEAWITANGSLYSEDFRSIDQVDRVLHAERVGKNRQKETYASRLDALPDGTVVAYGEQAWLVWKGRFLKWTFEGYEEAEESFSPRTIVDVLTPRSVVRTFASGFRTEVHGTAG